MIVTMATMWHNGGELMEMRVQDLIGKNQEWMNQNFKSAKLRDLKVGDICMPLGR